MAKIVCNDIAIACFPNMPWGTEGRNEGSLCAKMKQCTANNKDASNMSKSIYFQEDYPGQMHDIFEFLRAAQKQ